VEMNIPDDFGRLPQEQEIALFRVVQESLTNIHRHADSPVARIALFRSATEVRVRIEDEGKGIPAGAQREIAGTGVPGVGIRGMRERMLQLGGYLDIAPLGKGKGTRVMAQLPLMERPPHPDLTSEFRAASRAN